MSRAIQPMRVARLRHGAGPFEGGGGLRSIRRRARLVLVAALLAILPFTPARAHEGHDHGDAAEPPVTASSPQRLPDGRVLLPKPAQRQLGVRTAIVSRESARRAVELPGLVAMDPNAGGRVQASVPGRVEAVVGGLPTVGQRVVKGQALALVRTTVDPLARAGQDAQLAELRTALALADRRAARLRDLADTVPRKDIEAAESERASLAARIDALARGVAAVERLVAPVSGVIASANAVAGQVVDARELLFEIVDPTRLRIEATAADPALAQDIDGASVAVGGRSVPLEFVGAGRVLRGQALPLVFRAQDAALASLAVGLPVAVTVRTRTAQAGVPVPASALVRSAANTPIVWVKTQAERLEPRPVRTRPLDGARVLVVDGLAGGERVVVDGAPLLNQVR